MATTHLFVIARLVRHGRGVVARQNGGWSSGAGRLGAGLQMVVRAIFHFADVDFRKRPFELLQAIEAAGLLVLIAAAAARRA